jgi:hypothetical protein
MNEWKNEYSEWMNSGFQSSSVPMRLGLLFYRPFVPLKVDFESWKPCPFNKVPHCSQTQKHSFKKGYQPRADLVKVEGCYLLVVCHRALYTRRWNNYFCQVLNGEIWSGNGIEIESTVFHPTGWDALRMRTSIDDYCCNVQIYVILHARILERERCFHYGGTRFWQNFMWYERLIFTVPRLDQRLDNFSTVKLYSSKIHTDVFLF